jgi:hypothetical protein
MPSVNTFEVRPIGALVQRYLKTAECSVDPYERNNTWADFTNDLNPSTTAEFHMDATDFIQMLTAHDVRADVVLVDPPYSPRQVKECYEAFGRPVTQQDTQSGAVRQKRNRAICDLLQPEGIVITCGWNTVGMGKTLGFEIIEILLCCHGSAHNDTLVVVEQRI